MLRYFYIVLIFLFNPVCADQNKLNVVASIKPLHSLLSYLMDGVTEPDLIIQGNVSPHNYYLKPSAARKLEKADIIFWLGSNFESNLGKSLNALAGNADVIELLKQELPVLLRQRNLDEWLFVKYKVGDKNTILDPHIWLNIENVKTISIIIKDTLILKDKKNAIIYNHNLRRLLKELEQLEIDLKQYLSNDNEVRFLVSHDAFQYIELQYQLKSSGAISIHPDHQPSAKQLIKIKNIIKQEKIACIFSEPQYNNRLLANLIENTNVKIISLDHTGLMIERGKGQYLEMMKKLGRSMGECFR